MGNGNFQPPTVVRSQQSLQLKSNRIFTFSCPNPQCDIVMDVTKIQGDTFVECDCGNVTWMPGYKPPWWIKTRNFVLSLIASLLIGIISTLLVKLLID